MRGIGVAAGSHHLLYSRASPRLCREGGHRKDISSVLFRLNCPEIFPGQPLREHVETAGDNDWNIGRRVGDQRSRNGLFFGHCKERHYAERVTGLKTATDSRNLQE